VRLEPSIIVGVGERDAGDLEAKGVLGIGEIDAVRVLRLHLPDDLEPRHPVVVHEVAPEVEPPHPPVPGDRSRPRDRERPLAHEGVAAGEVLIVIVVPVLGERHDRRPLVPADLLVHRPVVRQAADVVTAANTEDGFARAMEDYVLTAGAKVGNAGGSAR